jgi:protein-S-isoprenylcysteine O-methyltransferase Ste14
MNVGFQLLPLIAAAVVTLCWLAFAAIFLLRKAPQAEPEHRRDSKSIVGVILQAASYAIVGLFHRVPFTPIGLGSRATAVSLSEECLLREALGPQFETYVRTAPALVPGLN